MKLEITKCQKKEATNFYTISLSNGQRIDVFCDGGVLDLSDGQFKEVNSIGGLAFYKCAELTSINLPPGLQSIGDQAFQECTSLQSINFPPALQSIGYGAFCQCTGLISIDFPVGLQSIGKCAFYRYTGLISISFPVGLQSIGRLAFSHCASLESINFPPALQSIEVKAFSDCTSLTSIHLPVEVKIVGHAGVFDGCTKLRRMIASLEQQNAVIKSMGISAIEAKEIERYTPDQWHERLRVLNLRRQWARVILRCGNNNQDSLNSLCHSGSGRTPQDQLRDFFAVYAGLRQFIGRIILRYANFSNMDGLLEENPAQVSDQSLLTPNNPEHPDAAPACRLT